jgi:hypothetical protein
VEVYCESKYTILDIDLFKLDNLYIEGLEFMIKFDILASDEPNKGVL